METIKLKAHIDQDGLLTVKMPEGVNDVDVDIVLVYAVDPEPEKEAQEAWADFVNRTYGMFADDPIERPPEAPLDVRDEIE